MSGGWKASMDKFVVDAYAWIEYLIDSEKGRKAAKIIESETNHIFTSSATIAEIVSKILRENKDLKNALNYISNFSTIINVTPDIAAAAGHIHFEIKKKSKNFGMLDAFVAATAKNLNAKILTGDNDFKEFKEAVMI